MIKKFMWDYFEKTGDVSAFLNYKDLSNNQNAETDEKINDTL